MMQANPLFELRGLECGYSNRPVLLIDELVLQQVPVTFILGPSGIGKSTLLELLGLMSDTLIQCKGHFHYNDVNGNKVDFSDFWNWPESKQSLFRKSNFSFVFQQTNLMNNLNVIENLCLPLMIQGQSYSDASSQVRLTANNMGLHNSIMERKTTEVSGGQLQRIAFTRALSANFRVLFGDEPTGNLDVNNAHNLMGHLRENLLEKNASAIVVSHDLQLAEKFADCIVTIKKESHSEGYIGRIDHTCITMK